MNGFESEVRSRIIGFDSHIRLGTYHDRGIEYYDALVEQIKDIDQIKGISPYILEKGLVRSSLNKGEGAVIRGADQATVVNVSDISKNIIYGELNLGMVQPPKKKNDEDEEDESAPVDEKPLPGIVLGFNLADKLMVGLGDKVTVGSLSGSSSLFGPALFYKQFRVAGYFQTGLYQFDDTFAYISLESAQNLFKMDSKVTGVELKLNNLNDANSVAEEIDNRLGYPYKTLTWFDMNRNLFSWMQIEKWAAFIILSLIIMVASFNIASTLI